MKKILPQSVWSNIIEIDLTNLSIQSLFENLKKTLERVDLLKDKIVEIKGTSFSDPVTRNLSDVAARNLNETITGSWIFSSPMTVHSISGPNNQNLLINARNYGIEIRIDEDSSGSDAFRITRGSGGSTTLMLVQNTGNVGIGTTFPTQRLDVSGNIRGQQFISTAATGTPPLQVSSTTLVTNLNADLLDGYNSSTSSTANTVAVRDASGNLSASSFVSTVSTGTPPLQVSSTTKVTNLNADLLDGYDSADFPRKSENATITGNWTFNNTISAGGLIVAGNTIANSSGIPYAPLPALGNRGRDILVDRVAVWGDGMYPFALDLYKSDGWFTIPRTILYGAYGQFINGSIGPRNNTTRVLRIYITGLDNARSIYDPTHQYWNNGRLTGRPWIRLIRGSNTWNGALSYAWNGSPNIHVYVLELPVSFLDGYFQVALGIWWDSNSPSWPTSNIPGDTVPDNYQNYGSDLQWTIYQAWFEIYDRY